MILLYSSEKEVQYIQFQPRYYIGIGAYQLPSIECIIKDADKVVLFGSSGWLGPRFKAPINKLIAKKYFAYIPEPIHEKYIADSYREIGYYIVDCESWQVWDICKKYNKPFKSIRYIIDLGDRKLMPIGINHFWQKYQHHKMQNLFNKYISEFI